MFGASPAKRLVDASSYLLNLADNVLIAEQAFRAKGSKVASGCGITPEAHKLRGAKADFNKQLKRVAQAIESVPE